MKKITLLFLILIFGNLAYAQEKLTRTEKLTATSKVWGFLKYYHPQVAKGNYNWDEQLFEVLPKIETATTKNDLSKIYLDWISSLGSIEECKKCNNVIGSTSFVPAISGMLCASYVINDILNNIK
mgnify:CR=1 FL=1